MGWTFTGTDRNFETSVEKFIGTSWKITYINNWKTIEIVGTQDEIFFIGAGPEEIFKKFDKSQKL